MRFGTAKEIITPMFPMKLACPGGNFDDLLVAIHDDIYVRCLAMDDGSNKTVFMAYDLLFHDRSLNDEIEKYAKEKYGMHPGAVIISHTHAHTTPASSGYNPGAHDEKYEKFLVERSKACLDRALNIMFDGTMKYGTFNADYNISRRGIRNGKFANCPNFNYEHDTKMNVICIRDMDDNIRSILMNYACHPVFYPALKTICGEFPGRLCQFLDTNYYGCLSLFMQSAGGDVRPRPTVKKTENNEHVWNLELGFAGVDSFAKCISNGVSSFIECDVLKPCELSIAAEDFEIELPIEPAPIDFFKEQQELHKDALPNPNKNNADYIINGGYEKMPHSMMLHCQAVRLSDDLYIATVGGEPCYGVEKEIVSAFGGNEVFFIGYTDSCAYIVDDVLLDEGGYEPTCHLEYRLIGPFKKGLNKLYSDSFKRAFEKISK